MGVINGIDDIRLQGRKRRRLRMAPGFVYACCPQNELQRVKIGFTTQPDPVYYCHSVHGRLLCPLEILSITGHCNARVAEGVVHLVLAGDRVAEKHEVFDLSSVRRGMTGLKRLEEAVAFAQEMDSRADLPVPSARDSAAERVQAREAKREKRARREQEIREERKRQKQADVAQREESKRAAAKAAEAAVEAAKAAGRVQQWVDGYLRRADSGQYVCRSQLYQAFRTAVKAERCSRTALGKRRFFHKMFEVLGEESHKARHGGHRDVFLGWSLVPSPSGVAEWRNTPPFSKS